jgi:hypothetical protein
MIIGIFWQNSLSRYHLQRDVKKTSGKFQVNLLPLVEGYLIPKGTGELLSNNGIAIS